MTGRFSRGLAVTLMIVLGGGTFLAVQALAGSLNSNQPALTAVLVIVLVALVFLPLQVSIERLVDRITGGSTPTAHQVLADLTALSNTTSADASNLANVAEGIGRRLGARSCRLTVIYPGLRDRVYAWPAGDAVAGETVADEDVVLPIQQDGERIGTIALGGIGRSGGAAGARMPAGRGQQLADIANSLGAIVAVNRLGIELERQLRAALAHAEEIAVSRRQAVAEMDNERRRLERNLHDGAQHHLVSLRMTLGLVEHGIASGHLDQARDGLDRLAAQIGNAETVLAETATGVSAIVLSDRGLVAALNAELSGAQPPIAVTTAHPALSEHRFPAEIEAAVYFCCLEAVNNARKHAAGASVSVQLREVDGTLHFTVQDDGPGFAMDSGSDRTGAKPGGRGLRNVTARMTAVGGKLTIRSVPGVGTTVEGSVSLPREQGLLDQVRELLREARQLYDGSSEGERLREVQTQLGRPLPAGATSSRADGARRAEAFKARSALRALEALVRSSPLGGDRALQLRYQLEQIPSETHELSEIDLLEDLRSGTLALSSDERQVAEELLGAAGTELRTRLGLRSDAGTGEVRQAAGRQLAHWQRRASHPASTRAVRDAAEVLVQTCEELLAQVGHE
ncbi:MAG: ATP-binding protein [Pseudonocardiaceae bacterium]